MQRPVLKELPANQPAEVAPSGTRVYHMLHICAVKPDSSEAPSWNRRPSLDSVNWETLPAEMKKVRIAPTLPAWLLRNLQRSINYSLLGRQDLTQFIDLLKAVSIQYHAMAVVSNRLRLFRSVLTRSGRLRLR